MATRKEFQKWLNQFPEDTIINVLEHKESNGYESYGPSEFIIPEFTNKNNGLGWEFTDWSKNKVVKPNASYYNTRTLDLGERC